MLSFDQRFVAELSGRIREDIEAEYAKFGKGLWVNRTDAAATGMQAVLIHAKIDGLGVALKHIAQVHEAMTGKVDKKQKEAA